MSGGVHVQRVRSGGQGLSCSRRWWRSARLAVAGCRASRRCERGRWHLWRPNGVRRRCSQPLAREGLARPLWHGSMHDPERSPTSAERSTRNPEPSPTSTYSCKTVQTPNLHPAKTQKGRGVTILTFPPASCPMRLSLRRCTHEPSGSGSRFNTFRRCHVICTCLS